MAPAHTQTADCYQNLFNHLSNEHGLTLTVSKMDEIIRHTLETVKRINSLPGNSAPTEVKEPVYIPHNAI
jgi:hypothetical protein